MATGRQIRSGHVFRRAAIPGRTGLFIKSPRGSASALAINAYFFGASGNATATITGVSATGQAGTITATGEAQTTLTGVAATAASGSVTAGVAVSVTLTGVSASVLPGTLSATGDANIVVTGVAGTGVAGTVTASADSDASVTISGAAATAAAGAITAQGDATGAISGVAATGLAGDVAAPAMALQTWSVSLLRLRPGMWVQAEKHRPQSPALPPRLRAARFQPLEYPTAARSLRSRALLASPGPDRSGRRERPCHRVA